MRLSLNKTVKTELGQMTVKEYLDKCIEAKAIFWEAKREGIKKIKYFAGLGSKTLEINKTMFKYAMSKVTYKFNAQTGYGE